MKVEVIMDKGTYLGHFHCNSLICIACKSLLNMLWGQGYEQTLSSKRAMWTGNDLHNHSSVYVFGNTENISKQNSVTKFGSIRSYINVYSIKHFIIQQMRKYIIRRYN